MTQTQKFLKGIENTGSCPRPKGQVVRRIKRRGAEYRARMDSLGAAHEQKRVRLLKARRERAEAAAAKAARK
jgi:hypothetical protein